MRIEPIVVHVPASHLYRGILLHAACEPGAWQIVHEGRQEAEVLLLFEEGSYAPADLLVDKGGQLTLHVAAYTTARGTSIPARIWRVKAVCERGDGLDLHLGHHLP
jgi:hypothetical protein